MKKLCKTFLILPVLLGALQVSAQLKQFMIRSANRSEIATNVIALSDSSSVISGFIYDMAGGILHADMLVMRVSQNGTIMWQQQISNSVSNGNNMPFALIQAANGDIIVAGVMGQNSFYQDNTAVIFRLDVTNGTRLAASFVRRDPDPHQNGELFFGVAELANGNIVAVGSSNYSNTGSASLISVFDASLNNLYNEVYDMRGRADDLYDIVAVDDSVYILGEYTDSYKDLHILQYFPGTTGGTIGWENFYDMGGQFNNNATSMFLNRPRRLYLRNDKLIFQGYGSESYGPQPYGQFIFECDKDGSNPDARYLENSGGRQYVGNTMVYPLDENKMYIVQNPTNAYVNSYTWPATSVSDAFIGQVDVFGSSDVLMQGKTLNRPGNQALLDVNFSSASILHMVGATTVATGNNDIYYVLSANVVNNINMMCDVDNDSLAFGVPDIYPSYQSHDSDSFVPDPNVDTVFSDPQLIMEKLCGDDSLTTPCSANLVDVMAVFGYAEQETNNCVFGCNAYVTPATGWTPVRYVWETPYLGGYSWPAVSVTHYSTSSSDSQPFTTPNGSGNVWLKVYVTLVNAQGDSCTILDSVRLDCNGGHGYVYYKNSNTAIQDINPGTTSDAGFTIYPNPSSGLINISSVLHDIKTVRVIDIAGKEVARYTYDNSNKASLSLEKLATGTYIIQINNRSQKLVNKTN